MYADDKQRKYKYQKQKTTESKIPEKYIILYRMLVMACLLSHGYASIVRNIAKLSFYQKREPFIIACSYDCITYKYMIIS